MVVFPKRALILEFFSLMIVQGSTAQLNEGGRDQSDSTWVGICFARGLLRLSLRYHAHVVPEPGVTTEHI